MKQIGKQFSAMKGRKAVSIRSFKDYMLFQFKNRIMYNRVKNSLSDAMIFRSGRFSEIKLCVLVKSSTW